MNRPGRNTVDDRRPPQAPDGLFNAPAVWAGQSEDAVPLDVHKIESGAPQSPVGGVQANQRPSLDTAGPQLKMAIEDAPEQRLDIGLTWRNGSSDPGERGARWRAWKI
jgi:hypothetical protein